MITILPAIDLKDGHCVRLRQGRADESTVYSTDPVEMARHWVGEGAEYLHIVDLDGAFQGHPVHTREIEAIVRAIPIPCEVGGGLRTPESIREVLGCGVARAIVGTRATSAPGALREWVAEFGTRLAVGIDARGGWVQVKGWVETTGLKAVDLARTVESLGVSTIIHTDTATDGMLGGTNVSAQEELCRAVACNVVASGGISTAQDIAALTALGCGNLVGAIVGKALYEKTVNLRELKAAV